MWTVKIDVEGNEGRTLRGMQRHLSRGVVEAVYLEMVSENLARAGTNASEVLGVLIDCGLTPYHCKEEDFSPWHLDKLRHPAGQRRTTMTVDGRTLTVAPVDMDVASRGLFTTDILAIRRDSTIARVAGV